MRLAATNLLVGSVVVALAMDSCTGASDRAAGSAGRAGVGITVAATTAPSERGVSGAGWGVDATRADDGHFYLDGEINGHAQRFLLDTGASTIAMGRQEAEALGLFIHDSDFMAMSQTAAGPIRVAPVTLNEVHVGTLSASDVEAVVVDTPTLQPLLGQSFLSRLGSVQIEGDRLTLR